MMPKSSFDLLDEIFNWPGTPPADPAAPPRWADLWLLGWLVVTVALVILLGGWW